MSAPSGTVWPDRPESGASAHRDATGASALDPVVRRRILLTLIAAGLAIVIDSWWRQTTATEVVGAAGTLTAAGRLAGLVGGYLLLVQVLLMSRVPVIERASSGARRSRWHRDLGAYVVVVVCLHVLLITLGYAAANNSGIWHEVATLLTTYQDMITAVVSFGILLVVSLMAMRAIRRRLPYGLWHASHASVYLVLLFVYGHQLADGQQFVLSEPARRLWIAAYLLVVAAIGYGRIVVPVRLNVRHRLRVASVVTELPGVVSVYVTGRDLSALRAAPGQYVPWRFVTPRGWWRSHPYSLSAAPNGEWLRLTVKAVGDESAAIADVPPGTRIWIDAPTGEFTTAHANRPRALLIAAGTGITPVRALMETMPVGTVVIYRARSAAELIFRDEVDSLAVDRGIRLWYALGRRTDPDPARLFTPDGLRELIPDIQERDVYVCGPTEFAARVNTTLAEIGVPPRQLHMDSFEL
ncbi:MAG TPA: ferredoxin reductase family protein [Micromonosporaceae bacterium]|nr:ferredoxin reductase family protein [Micromonosporaceae bacterium]